MGFGGMAVIVLAKGERREEGGGRREEGGGRREGRGTSWCVRG